MDKTALRRLTDAGLIVLALGGSRPGANCYALFKPSAVPGNRRPGWETELATTGGDIPCDAPCATLGRDGDRWLFCVHEFFPDSGPGDFCREFDKLEEAAEAVWEYYFGDPRAMNPDGLPGGSE